LNHKIFQKVVANLIRKQLLTFFKFLLNVFLISLLPSTILLSQETPRDNQTISFEQIGYYEGVISRLFADFDGDGNEEFLFTTGKHGVLVNDFDNENDQTACHLAGAFDVIRFYARDFSGDPSPEIFIPLKQGDSTWIEIWGVDPSFGSLECQFILKTESVSGFDANNDGEWDGIFKDCQVSDINNDGQKDILSTIDTGYDKNPRGIWTFDGRNGKLLWKFPTAGQSGTIECADATGDSKAEIIFNTWGPDNKNIIGDTDDSHSYLFCCNQQGQQLWRHEMGGIFADIVFTLGDIDNDRQTEILCSYFSGDAANKNTHFELQIRSGRTGKVEKYIQFTSKINQIFLTDLDRDGNSEIVTCSGNFIYILNSDLKVLHKTQFSMPLEAGGLGEIVDINGDGELEVFAASANRLLVYNSQLNLIGQYRTEMRIDSMHYFKHPVYGGLISLIQGRREKNTNGLFLKINQTSSVLKGFSPQSGFSHLFLLLVFVAGVGLTLLVLKLILFLRKSNLIVSERRIAENRDNFLKALSVFEHGATAATNLVNLGLFFKNIPQDQPVPSEFIKKLDETVQTYLDVTSNRLTEIVNKSKLADTDKKIIESFEKNKKELENLLNRYQKTGLPKDRIDKLAREVPKTIESLEEIIKLFGKNLSRFYRCDVLATIKETLLAVSPCLKKEDIQFQKLLVEGDIAGYGFISKTEFSEVIEELLTNAVCAMKNAPTKEIMITIVSGEKRIRIEVSDTGCGIDSKNYEKIFDRDFSTKPEGGFGLYHVKAILDKYGGKIKILQGSPGKGTTIRVDIKKI